VIDAALVVVFVDVFRIYGQTGLGLLVIGRSCQTELVTHAEKTGYHHYVLPMASLYPMRAQRPGHEPFSG
jgi:hypothetical protein